MTIIVTKNISLSDIEQHLDDLSSSAKSSKRHLRLPSHIHLGGIGIEASLVQLIISWGRKQESHGGELHTYLDSIDNKSSKKFVTTLHGLVASVMAPKISLNNHNEIERKSLLKDASELIEKMDLGRFEDIRRGPSLFITSIYGAKHRYLKSIYKKANEIKPPPELIPEVKRMLQAIGEPSGDKKGIGIEEIYHGKAFCDHIAWLLFELLQNTEDHAQRDWTGTLYRKGVAGFYFSIQKIKTHNDWNRIFPNHEPSWSISCNNVRLLELSIFDSGPGMARRWLGKDFDRFSFEQEKKAIIECFKKNKTSKETISGRGMGLNTFLTILHERKGLFRVRTGRTEISKSFLEEKEYDAEINMEDFSQEKPPSEGTVISAYIPLLKGEKNE